MKCPACGHGMTETAVRGINVDVCKGGCGGLWFDWFELKKVDEEHESVGGDLLHAARDPHVQVDYAARRDCPRCDGIVMMRHFASVKREIEVDECARCGGFFLDHGELNRLRSQYGSEDERQQAAESLFAELFDAGLEDLHDDSEEQAERSRAFARIFRFVLPSHWLPGKQKWGAF
ncbi:MAG: zf-TFIIB domain-containing protein [Krumholzibacteria bacterium]|nr:zf-TFIIB domain-containing protein [Candidatus Krumholzibacteria bacterium]